MSNVAGEPTGRVAFATLLTNDGYVDAALVLAHSLRKTKTTLPLVVLVTSEVSEQSKSQLELLFDWIIRVTPITGKSNANLSIIGRPDLASTLTKLHFWSLTQFSRVLYLDADTLVISNIDHLFSLPQYVDFAASPELGFPDCFNAGVMLLRPSEDTYSKLLRFANTHESFDGGDQGLLNIFFGDGTYGHSYQVLHNGDNEEKEVGLERPWHRLSFTYNIEMHQVFRLYIPAVLRYRDQHKVLHFIGRVKPWHFPDGDIVVPADASPYFKFYAEMVWKWWDTRQSMDTEIMSKR